MNPAAKEMEANGFIVAKNLFSQSDLSLLEDAAKFFEHDSKEKGGGRNIFQKIPALLRVFKNEAILKIVRELLGPRVGISEGIYLNKKEDANWLVSWHQDLFISVKSVMPVEGFHSWTNKQGVPYVQPPHQLLQKCLWVRVNLDDNDIDNGCLKVSPGSHQEGKIAPEKVATVLEKNGEVAVLCKKSESILFKPLLLHASSKSSKPNQRRVFQVLFSGHQFENGLEWPY